MPRGALSHVLHVGPNRKQREQGAQNILALGNPRHRLHVERMNGKNRRDECAPGRSFTRAIENPEQQYGIQNVEKHTRDVVPARIKTVDLRIQHMREPCQRMPVRLELSGQRPDDALRGQAGGYVRVLINVIGVVKINETVVPDLSVDEEIDRNEAERDPDDRSISSWQRRHFRRRRLLDRRRRGNKDRNPRHAGSGSDRHMGAAKDREARLFSDTVHPNGRHFRVSPAKIADLLRSSGSGPFGHRIVRGQIRVRRQWLWRR